MSDLQVNSIAFDLDQTGNTYQSGELYFDATTDSFRFIDINSTARRVADEVYIATVSGSLVTTLQGYTNSLALTSGIAFVNKNPSTGQFSSVVTTIASITNASATNQFVISIGPGTYTESNIVMKPYVYLVGEGNATVIKASDPNQTIITGIGNSSISNLVLTGASGTTGKAIYCTDFAANTAFSLNNVTFGANYTQGEMYANTSTVETIITGCFIGTASSNNASFTNGFYAHSNSGILNRLTATTLICRSENAPYPTGSYINLTGTGTQFIGSVIHGLVGSPTAVGIQIANGAVCQVSDVNLQGFTKGIWVQNVGVAPDLQASTVILKGNTTDLQIDHATAIGTFTGHASEAKIVNANSAFPILIQDESTGNLLLTGTLKKGTLNNGFQDITTLITDGSTMGLNQGGVLSSSGTLTLYVSAGYGYVEIEPEDSVKITWNDTSVTLPTHTGYSNLYIYFNQNGILSYNASFPDTTNNILLGRVATNSTKVDVIDLSPLNAEHASNAYDKMFRRYIGPVFGTGCTVTTDGSGHISVTAGNYNFSMNEFITTGMTNGTFEAYHYVSGSTMVGEDRTVVDDVNYNNTTSGLVPMTTGYYAKHTLYTIGQGAYEKYFLVYAQSQFPTLLQTENADIPIPPTYFTDGMTLIAGIVTQKNSGIIEILDERPRMGFKAAGTSAASTHGQLLGLTADDHIQYMLSNGIRAMTGNLSLGGNNITNIGQVDGVVVSGHASRHLPNGLDPLATAAPGTSLDGGTTNAIGVQNSFARSDHTHAVNSATESVAGLMTASDKGKLNHIQSTISGDLTNSGTVLTGLVNAEITNRQNAYAYNAYVTNAVSGQVSTETSMRLASDSILSGNITNETSIRLATANVLSGIIISSGQAILYSPFSLTNKTLTSSTNKIEASAFQTTTNAVYVSGSVAPISGQALIATSATIATWQNDIQSLNGLSVPYQQFASASGTAATDFSISSTGGTHTFTIPDAGLSSRGLVTTGAQTFQGIKTFQDNSLQVQNPAHTSAYTISGSAITANRNIILPVTIQDEFFAIRPTYYNTPTPLNPTGTTSATGVMMGLSGSITPRVTGTIFYSMTADLSASVKALTITTQLRTGTGAKPASAAALTGTTQGSAVRDIMTTASGTTFSFTHPISISDIVSGLVINTAYWLDVSLAVTVGTGTATLANVTLTAFEL